MHYADGKPAKAGDLIITNFGQTHEGHMEMTGVLVSITPGATACNGSVVPVAKRSGDGPWFQCQGLTTSEWSVTVGQCMKVEFTPEVPKTEG